MVQIMTLAELKAQAAKVFAEEETLWEVHRPESAPFYCAVRDTGETSPMFSNAVDAHLYVTERGLEAVWRFMAESISGDIMRVAAKGGHIKLESAALALEAVFGELGRQEG